MSTACRRFVCRAHNAFVPGAALLAVADNRIVAYSTDSLAQKRSRTTTTDPTRPTRSAVKQKVGRITRQIKEGAANAPQPTRDARDRHSSDISTSQRSIIEPHPPFVDYKSGQKWRILSDVDDEERTKRIVAFLQWTRAKKTADTSIEAWMLARPDVRQGSPRTSVRATDARLAQGMEYEGQVVYPKQTGPSPFKLPWLWFRGKETFRAMKSNERLRWEIELFAKSMQPTETEHRARQAVEADVRDAVALALPDQTLEVFGSQSTGLVVATSDLDLRLCLPSDKHDDSVNHMAPRQADRKELIRRMHDLTRFLDQHPKFMLVHPRYARYPLISMQHKDTGIDVQVVCSNDTAYQRTFVAEYLEEFPALKDVYVTVRAMFDVRGLCDVFRGGVGSYGIFMMIVAALKIQKERNGIVISQDQGNLLQHFLQFWAEVDTYTYGVSIDPPRLFHKLRPSDDELNLFTGNETSARPRAGTLNPKEPYLLSLIDPSDAGNDLGRKIYAIKHILATLRHLHIKLMSKMWDTDIARTHDLQHFTTAGWTGLIHKQAHGKEIKFDGLDEVLLNDRKKKIYAFRRPGSLLFDAIGPAYKMYQGRRDKMQEFGSDGARMAAARESAKEPVVQKRAADEPSEEQASETYEWGTRPSESQASVGRTPEGLASEEPAFEESAWGTQTSKRKDPQ